MCYSHRAKVGKTLPHVWTVHTLATVNICLQMLRTLFIFGVKLDKRKTQSSLHSHKKSGRWFVVSQRLFKAWQEEYLAVCISMYAFSITRKYLFRPSNKVSLSLCNEQGDQQTDTTKAIILLLCGQYRIALIDSLQSQVAFCNTVVIKLSVLSDLSDIYTFGPTTEGQLKDQMSDRSL